MQPHRTVRAGPSVWEHAPVTTYPEPHLRPGSLFVLAVLRPAWAYRVELAAVTSVAVAYYWLSARYSGRTAEAVILAAAVLVAAIPFTRQGLAGVLHRSHLRRRWTLACRHADLANRNDHTPRITKAGLVPSGDLLCVRMPAGAAVADLERAAEPVAAFLEARELRVTREAANARYARVVVVRRDPLADLPGLPWPQLDAPRLSLWQPIPVGINEDGQLVTVSLIERNVLLGGEPGGGKSVGQSMLTATAALDPACELTLLDGKYVELAPWVGCATRTVGPSQDECVDVLRALVAEMDARYLTLVANRQRKISPRGQLDPARGGLRRAGVLPQHLRPQRQPGGRQPVPRPGEPGPGGRVRRPGRHAEAQRGRGPDLAAGPVRLPLGVPVHHPADERHDPWRRLGDRRLLREHGGRGAPGDRVPAARGRPAGPAADLLPGRQRPRPPGTPGRAAPRRPRRDGQAPVA
jgi:hypothetical protein